MAAANGQLAAWKPLQYSSALCFMKLLDFQITEELGPITREDSETDTADECEDETSEEDETFTAEEEEEEEMQHQQDKKQQPSAIDPKEEQLKFRLSLLTVDGPETWQAEEEDRVETTEGGAETSEGGAATMEAVAKTSAGRTDRARGGAKAADSDQTDAEKKGFVSLKTEAVMSAPTHQADSDGSDDSDTESQSIGHHHHTDTASVCSTIHPKTVERRASAQVKKIAAKQKAQRIRRKGQKADIKVERKLNMQDIKTSMSGFWLDE